MQELSSEEEETSFVGTVTKANTEISDKECYVTLTLHGTDVKFKIDTGSQVNIIPNHIFETMNIDNVEVKPTKTCLTSYSGDKLIVIGKCKLNCMNQELDFYITKTNQPPILGFKASQDLQLIQVVCNVHRNKDNHIVKEFPSVFKGLGCLKQNYHIAIDKSVKPVINPPRKVPTALREPLKLTLEEMERKNVIRKVDKPTEWVSSLVVVEKPKSRKLRICLDPRNLNQAIKREHYQLPTIEDITTRMAGAKVFSKLDANHGYWQIPLDEESQLLTTFNTPFGRYCYLRMPFGIKSAQEVFQKRMAQCFEDLPGVETDIDDIIVWGTSKEDHDGKLKNVLKRCQEINLTLNLEKCQFGLTEVCYVGHMLTSSGIKPDPEKVIAITEMPAPTDKKGIERLLGTVNYLAKFIPNMSTVTEPIRALLKSDNEFVWETAQKHAFEEIKQILSKEPVLKYFSVKKPVIVSCDA